MYVPDCWWHMVDVLGRVVEVKILAEIAVRLGAGVERENFRSRSETIVWGSERVLMRWNCSEMARELDDSRWIITKYADSMRYRL